MKLKIHNSSQKNVIVRKENNNERETLRAGKEIPVYPLDACMGFWHIMGHDKEPFRQPRLFSS